MKAKTKSSEWAGGFPLDIGVFYGRKLTRVCNRLICPGSIGSQNSPVVCITPCEQNTTTDY